MEKRRNEPGKVIAAPEWQSAPVVWNLDEQDKRFLRACNICPD